MKKAILCLLLLTLFPTIAFGSWEPTKNQMFIMDVARIEGSVIGWPETIQAIQVVESSCGVNKYGPKGNDLSNRYFGSSQMKVSTARYVLETIRKDPKTYSNEQIMIRLLINDVWAIQLSRDYFMYLMDKFKHHPEPWKHAVLAYNRGPGTVKKYGLKKDPYGYVKNIGKTIRTIVRPYNRRVKTMYAAN